MEQFFVNKIYYLKREREHLEALMTEADDLLQEGIVMQEITRNEGLIEIYKCICETQGWDFDTKPSSSK